MCGFDDPWQICGAHLSVDHRTSNAKSSGVDFFMTDMRGGQAREFLDDQIKPRELLAGKTVIENQHEFAAFFGKQRQIAFRSTNVSGENHPGPQKDQSISLRTISVKYRNSRVAYGVLPRGAIGVVPVAAIALNQRVGFTRTPASGRVLRNLGTARGAPHLENGIHK